MKKYKTTSSKKHTQFTDRVTDDSVTMMEQESILDESVDQETDWGTLKKNTET